MRLGKDWKIERMINKGAPIYGTLRLTRIAPRKYLWKENLFTPLDDGSVMEGTQSYHIERQGPELSIFFAAGAQKELLFQRVNVYAPEAWHPHQCGEDLYKSHVQIVSRETIIVEHIVKGPRKDYTMQSIYSHSN